MIAASFYPGRGHERPSIHRFYRWATLIAARGNSPDEANQSCCRSSHLQKPALLDKGICSSRWLRINRSLPCSDGPCEVTLDGKPYLAITDTQASANIMSLGFARREKLRLDWAAVPFTLGDGTTYHSVARATAECSLPSTPKSPRRYEFFILPNLNEQLILGRTFLNEADMAQKPSCRTDFDGNDSLPARVGTSLKPIEYSRWEVKAFLKYGSMIEQTFIVPDTGSDINLMSVEYARTINIEIKPRQVDLESIHLANGRVVQPLGSAIASINFFGKADRFWSKPIHFAVVKNLPFPVALGKNSIKQFRIFKDKSIFEWSCAVDDNAILCIFNLRKEPRKPNSDDVVIVITDTIQAANDTALRRVNRTKSQNYLSRRQLMASENPANNQPHV